MCWYVNYPLSKKFGIAAFAIGLLAVYILNFLRAGGVLGDLDYFLLFGFVGMIAVIFVMKRAWGEPWATVTEKSVSVDAPFAVVCEQIPMVVERNRWKLTEVDKSQGHFRVKIGMSLWTFSQIMLIDVDRTDEGSTKVKLHCEAPHVLRDHGQNSKMIAKFRNELDNSMWAD